MGDLRQEKLRRAHQAKSSRPVDQDKTDDGKVLTVPTPKRKYAVRKHLKDPNLCRLPGKGYGPVHTIPLGYSYAELRELFLEFMRAFSPRVDHDNRAGDPMVPSIPNIGEFYPYGWDSTFHLMTPEQRDVANRLYVAIGEGLNSAYGYGLDYGQDLLSQLARGELRIGDFEKPHRKCGTCGRTLPTGGNICRYCNYESGKKHE